MYEELLRSLVLGSLTCLVAVPVVAQVRADIGPIHIRIANSPPPSARYERRPTRPQRDALWVDGSWHRQDDQWAWISGRWEQPRNRNDRWVRARYTREGCHWYKQDNCRWRYEPAHWSNETLVEGNDYREWKDSRRSGQGNGRR
jgi:hypothetical protein